MKEFTIGMQKNIEFQVSGLFMAVLVILLDVP